MTEHPDNKALERLVSQAQKGSEAAWKELVEAHYGLVYTIAYSRLADHEAVEDLVQEVFLRAWLQIGQLRKASSLPFWIGQMARHLGTTWYRNNQRRSELLPMIHEKDGEMDCVEDDKKSPREQAMEKEQRENLLAAINDLPPKEREVILLHVIEGLPKNAVAKQTGLHPSTVGRTMDRSISKLREVLGSSLAIEPASLSMERSGPAKSVACAGVIATLTPAAKQALLTAASKGLPAAVSYHSTHSATTLSIGFLSTLWQSIQSTLQGLLYMNTVKMTALAATVVTAASIGGYTIVNNNSADKEVSPPKVALLQTANGLELQNNPYLIEGYQWKFQQNIEIDMEGQWVNHLGITGVCEVLNSNDPETRKLELVLNEINLGDHMNNLPVTITNKPIRVTTDSEGNITDIASPDNSELDSSQGLFIMMALTGVDLGPIMWEEQFDKEITKTVNMKVPATTNGQFKAETSYKYRGIEQRDGKEVAIFDVNTNSTIGGIPFGGDNRTRVQLNRQDSIGKGEWLFDTNNPVNSHFFTQGTSPVNQVNLLITVPGRSEPVIKEIPMPANQPWRSTITFSDI